MLKNKQEAGNVVLALFAAVVLVAGISLATFNYIKGPLNSSISITKKKVADHQMTIAGQVAVSIATSQANSGDCDADGYVEPLEWRDAITGEPAVPTGGGYLPNSISSQKLDPWNRPYGYCVWDNGAQVDAAGCGGATQKRLRGSGATTLSTIAIISSGPDKIFNTTCNDFVDGNADTIPDTPLLNKSAGSDDMLLSYNYAEATGASMGMWSLKSGSSTTATIGPKNIEVQGNASFGGALTADTISAANNEIDLNNPLIFADQSVITTCDAASIGVMRTNASTLSVESCKDLGGGLYGFQSLGGPVASAFDTTATCSTVADRGKVKFDTVSTQALFCDGSAWVPFSVTPVPSSIVSSISSSTPLSVVGPCSGGGCPWAQSAGTVTVTFTNTGATETSAITSSTTLPAQNVFDIFSTATTCTFGTTLKPFGKAGDSCSFTMAARAQGDGNFFEKVYLSFAADGTIESKEIYATASGFPCATGAYGWGGILIGTCAGAAPAVGALIMQEPGCSADPNEPLCTGAPGADIYTAMSTIDTGSGEFIWLENLGGTGAQNSVNNISYYSDLNEFPILNYCDKLVKGGYSDWFLPSQAELASIPAGPLRGPTYFIAGEQYMSSRRDTTVTSSFSSNGQNVSAGTGASISLGIRKPFRCFRKHGTALPAATVDTNPEYRIAPNIGAGSDSHSKSPTRVRYVAAGAVYTEYYVTSGINQAVTFSVSGGGSPTISVDGGVAGSSVTVNPYKPHTVAVTATASVTAGTETTVNLTFGDDTGTLKLRVVDPAIIKKMFVTSTTYNGNLGGIAGADAKCQTQATAAGLPSAATYRALISTSTVAAFSRIDPYTSRFETVGGLTIANDLGDLTSGNPINSIIPTENNMPNSFGGVFTFSDEDLDVYASNTCVDGTSTAAGQHPAVGDSNSRGQWIFLVVQANACAQNYPIYCYGPN